VLLRVARKPSQVQQSGSEWLDLRSALQAGIPAPLRKILQQLAA
jgi:hypothetical protein